MNKFKKITFTLRVLTGTLIALHGLFRILFLSKYIDFVLNQFYDVIPVATGLTVGASLLPFLEFFIGLLIIGNVSLKRTLWFGFTISAVMSFFIILQDLYPRLIYHCLVAVLIVLVSIRTRNQQTPTLSV